MSVNQTYCDDHFTIYTGWGTHVYLWRIHFNIWQNQYNIVKFKNKIKLKKINKTLLKKTNIESLCCTPETNIILYVNYVTIKKNSSYPTQANIQSKKAD